MKARLLWLLAPTTILLAIIAATPGRAAVAPPAALTAFTHGIASGDVTAAGAVLWTRVDASATITAQVTLDPAFTTLAFEQSVTPGPETDFTAKLRAEPLEPGQSYFYRWVAAGATSATGSFRTAPAPGAAAPLRFAFTGDSDGTRVGGVPGYSEFEALDAARLEDPDFFVYLGDMIYSDSLLRPAPAVTLEEYRETWRANRTIQALPDLLAAVSTYAIWDDHEVRNDYDGQTVDPTLYAHGRQATLEYTPIWPADLPQDPTCAGDPLFRSFSWGATADLIVLDERSCRSADAMPACNLLPGVPDPAPTLPAAQRILLGLPPAPPPGCLDAINDPTRTFLGPVQKQHLKDALLASTAPVKIVVNEVPIQQLFVLPYDRWEGYGAERDEILHFIRDSGIEGVLFVTADIHANFINEVYVDFFADPQPLAWEAVTGPIATGTLEEAILQQLGADGLAAAHAMFDTLGVECRHLDAYSYGLVEIDPAAASVTVSLKDDTGAVLVDQVHPERTCTLTLGPPAATLYLPLVVGGS